MSATYKRMFVLLNTPVGLFAGGCDDVGQIQYGRMGCLSSHIACSDIVTIKNMV